MQNDKNILSRAAHNDGMTVPEGYFESFNKRMTASLPERPELSASTPTTDRSLWQRIRPYAYMAAMFGGVWCMLKLFTIISTSGPQPLESNPIMAEAFGNETFINEYVISDLNQWDIYDELMEDGIDPQSLIDSLNITSSPEIQ